VPQYGDHAQNRVGRSGASNDDNATVRPEARSTTSRPASDDAAAGAVDDAPVVPGTEPDAAGEAGACVEAVAVPVAPDTASATAEPVVPAPPAVPVAGLPQAVATPSTTATAATR